MKNKIEIFIRGILIPLIIYVGISIFIALIFMLFLKDNTSLNIILKQGIANIILIIIFIPLYFSNKKDMIINKSLGFKEIKYLISLGFSLCILCNVILSFFFDLSKNAVTNGINEVSTNFGLSFSIVLVAIIVPIIEEILFRGFFFDTIKELTNIICAIIISSLLFAIAHGNIEQGIYAFVAGLVLAYVRYKYQSVIYSMIMHLVMNFTTLIFSSTLIYMPNLKEKLFMIFIMILVFLLSIFKINWRNYGKIS